MCVAVVQKNLGEYITKSKSKKFLFDIWYYILPYPIEYPANVNLSF